MFRRWFRKLFPRAPDAASLNETGIALWQAGELAAAERQFRAALAQYSGHAPSASNLGMVLFGQGKFEEALPCLRRAVELDPRHVGARANLGGVLHRMQSVEESLLHFREAMRLGGENPHLLASSLRPLMDACAWDEVADRLGALQRDADENRDNWADQIMPFVSLFLPISEALQLRIARWHADKIEAGARALPRPSDRTGSGACLGLGDAKLRIGYLSSDFHDHATAYLATEMLEAHDSDRFDIFAYSSGPEIGGDYRRRIKSACSHFGAHFVDIRTISDAAAAARIAADGIDILVDMNGHTAGGRLEIFALRPAPIQVAFLGYPGTTGSTFIDYLIVDRHIAPPGSEAGYSESVVRMPHSYQPNGRPPAPLPGLMTREEAGLPKDAFVFCCFNQHCKIEPLVFGMWMRILAAVPRSVLWLIEGNRLSETRLHGEARRAGIEPQRLIFAPFVARARHLARHRLADLCLDTHFVNGHTTGSDVLLAGAPMLTWPGSTLAARVGASLLHAAGLPELIASSEENYIDIAIGMARAPQRLIHLRAKLAAAHAGAPLFQAGMFAADLERALAHMAQLKSSGLPARGFNVCDF